MAENRNASPQSVKDDTFDGDRLVGSGNGMSPGYSRGVTGSGRVPAALCETATRCSGRPGGRQAMGEKRLSTS